MHPLFYPSTYSPSYTSTHLSIHPLFHLPTPPAPPHPSPFICLPASHPFIYSPIHTGTRPPICLPSTYPSIHSSISALLSIHLLSPVYQTTCSSTRHPPTHTPTHPHGHSATYYPSSPTHHLFIYLVTHQRTDLSTQPLICPAVGPLPHTSTHSLCPPFTYINHSFILPPTYPFNRPFIRLSIQQLPVNLRLSTHPSTRLSDQPIKHPSKCPIDHLPTKPSIHPSFPGTDAM